LKQIQRISSYALIVRDEKILLCRISQKILEGGRWTLPGGGIDFGEHPERGVIREVKEETGFDVRLDGLVKVDSEVFRHPDREAQAIRIVYRATITGGTLKHETDESTDRCDWFTRKEAMKLPLVSLARLGVRLAFSR
jgi:ADP-ribose pyrophosphatase YjhB (NUDIX family)